MYVVVAGAGDVGYRVAKRLVQEHHEVVVIESDPAHVEKIKSSGTDLLVLQGNAASIKVLEKEAHVDRADFFLALTGDDEVNMVAAALASSYGVPYTIARVNNPDYVDRPQATELSRIGIRLTLCPELIAAEKVCNTLLAPSLTNLDVFAGRVLILEVKVAHSAPAAGKRIADLQLPEGVNFVAVNRDGHETVARGDTVLHVDDRAIIALTRQELTMEVEALLGHARYVQEPSRMDRIVIAGASRIGLQIAKQLQGERELIIVEPDLAKARYATEVLDDTLVLSGSATDRAFLDEEDIGMADAFIAASDTEEYNILACLMAKRMGVKKAVAVVKQSQIRDVIEATSIDLAIEPLRETVGAVLRHVTRSDTGDLLITRGQDAEIIEYAVRPTSRVANKVLKKAGLPRESTCVAILRGDEVILPRGDTPLLVDDHVVIYTNQEAKQRLERLFL